MNSAQKINQTRARAVALLAVLCTGIVSPMSLADHHAAAGRVTLPVVVEGLRFASESFVNALVLRSADGELVSGKQKKVQRCRDSDDACERARALSFKFDKLDLGTQYVLVVCHLDRRESDCPRNAKGETVDVGRAQDIVLVEDPAHVVDAEGIEIIVLLEDANPHVVNLKDKY